MSDLSRMCGAGNPFAQRNDCTVLAFDRSERRRLERYLGVAKADNADPVLNTVRSNFLRWAAAAATKPWMAYPVQLEDRVDENQARERVR